MSDRMKPRGNGSDRERLRVEVDREEDVTTGVAAVLN